jgi:hypothetical protein
MRFERSRQSFCTRIVAATLAVVLMSSTVAPLRAAGQDPVTPGIAAASQDAVEHWKQELADAKARRTKGHQMEVGGFLLAIGGDILATVIALHCHEACDSAPALGLTAITSGIVVGMVGRARAQDANVEIGALLTREPKAPVSVAIPLGKDSPLSITVGQTTGVSYRVRW